MAQLRYRIQPLIDGCAQPVADALVQVKMVSAEDVVSLSRLFSSNGIHVWLTGG